ncbi:MAG: glycosyltransferase family 1 protein [Vulcanimicrobiaceae bacterium]
MRIAMTNAFLPTEQHSGVPYQVHYLANALMERGHAVTLFSYSDAPVDARYGAVRFRRPKLPPRYYPFFMAYELAKTDFTGFDVVHAHGDNYLRFASKPPLVRTFHGSAIDEFANARTLRRRAFQGLTIALEELGRRRAASTVGVSEATRTRIPRIAWVIPCGVDVDAFVRGEKSATPTVFFVGAEEGRKRGRWFADLFAREVLPHVPAAKLLMVSDVVSSEPGIERLGRISQDDLRRLYRESWVFCLPSTYEGFGVPYIEAMASGTPVVATVGNPGAREVLGDGEFGAFVDDAALGATIVSLLTDSQRRDALAARGLTRSATYSWASVARAYEELYSRTIGAATGR